MSGECDKCGEHALQCKCFSPHVRKKNYKDHKCTICNREFKSIRNFVNTCSRKCFNYSKTQKYWDNMTIGVNIDPHNPPTKTIYRKIALNPATLP